MENKQQQGSIVNVKFYRSSGKLAAEGTATVHHVVNTTGYGQDIVNTQDALPDGWQRDWSSKYQVVVSSVTGEPTNHNRLYPAGYFQKYKRKQ